MSNVDDTPIAPVPPDPQPLPPAPVPPDPQPPYPVNIPGKYMSTPFNQLPSGIQRRILKALQD